MHRATSSANSGHPFQFSPTTSAVAFPKPRNIANGCPGSNSLDTLDLSDDLEVHLFPNATKLITRLTIRFTGPARRRWMNHEASAAPAPVQPRVRRRREGVRRRFPALPNTASLVPSNTFTHPLSPPLLLTTHSLRLAPRAGRNRTRRRPEARGTLRSHPHHW